jgi:hypothetical protein
MQRARPIPRSSRRISQRLWLLLFSAALAAPAAAFDEALYATLLERHTRHLEGDLAGTRVDYAALAGPAAGPWGQLVASLAASDPRRLATREERLAFWIDAYNVLAIDLVVRHYPVDGIRDIGSLLRPVWKRTAGRIGDRDYSLDDIEHGILRPLGDPRVHAAVICASASCPPLRREPFRNETLDAQLDDATRQWLAHPHKGLRIDRKRETVVLSRIFEWFEEDFAASGGALAFAARYAPEKAREYLASHPNARVDYFDYDWSLNDLAPR